MKKSLNIKGRVLDLSKPVVMGILNITTDSFYEASRIGDDSSFLLKKAGEMINDGASILDVGGYSTRPGAKEVSSKEEFNRVIPAIRLLKKTYPDICLSVDTFRAEVAEAAIDEGVDIINDVSGGSLDDRMFGVVAESKLPYILMHMRGTPSTMQGHVHYGNLVKEIIAELNQKIKSLQSIGVADVLIDPGFGFSKTLDQNYSLLESLNEFRILGCPVLAGLSRKSMIYKFLGTDANHSLQGTIALNMFALLQGASVLRVHDVREAKQSVDLFNKIQDSKIS